MIIKNSKQYKKEIIKLISNLSRNLRANQYETGLNDKELLKIKKDLESMQDNLDAAIGTGKENYDLEAKHSIELIEKLGNDLSAGLNSVILRDVKKLQASIDKICDIIEGNYVETTKIEKEKNGKIAKLDSRIKVLEKEQNSFLENKIRLEENLRDCLDKENDLNEKLMLADDNITSKMIFRDINANKKNIAFIETRCENYNACFNLMKTIIFNLKEKLKISKFDNTQLKEIEFIIDRYLKANPVNKPEVTLMALRNLETEMEEIIKNTNKIDNQLFNVNNENSDEMEQIQQYKLALMQKQNLDNKKKELDTKIKQNNNIEGETDNGIF